MQWPSQRVPPGGIFHPPKVKFSSDTSDYLKLLIDEAKLATIHRQKSKYTLRSGDSTPSLRRNPQRGPKILIQPGSPRRRSLETIIQSGAYERDPFVPRGPTVDREKIKEELQRRMAYGKNESPRRPQRKKIEVEEPPPNRFDELVREIKEREEWLEEMKELGEDHKYRSLIEEQIKEKVREMKTLKRPD